MATMQDVARLANVSLSTVSYALTDIRPVSPATKARIEAAMAELGYHRNAAARSLASKRTHVLALPLPLPRARGAERVHRQAGPHQSRRQGGEGWQALRLCGSRGRG